MSETLLSTEHLRKCFGGVVATDTLSLEVVPGEIHPVIGPNGAGKTTLVNLLSGLLKPDAGEIQFEGRPLTRLPAAGRVNRGLARSFQITSVLRDFTAADNVALTVQAPPGPKLPVLETGADGLGAAPTRRHLPRPSRCRRPC